MALNLAAALRLVWIASILPVVIASLPISRFRHFGWIISEIGKRGKTPPSKSQKFTVPHKFFGHFYVLGVCWTSFLLGSMWLYACRTTKMDANHNLFGPLWNCVFLLLLMEIHVVRRLYESFFVLNHSSSARMHVLGYLTGLIYYMAAPPSLCTSFILDGLNYTYQAMKDPRGGIVDLEITVWDFFKPLTQVGSWQWAGGAVYFWGWIHQLRCHRILGSLRKGKRVDEYVIPRGDWFEVSSSAHYLAEIVIYIGFFMASGGADPTVALVLAFVVVNLVFHAAETHRWYLQKFEDYPRSRKAIIPLVY